METLSLCGLIHFGSEGVKVMQSNLNVLSIHVELSLMVFHTASLSLSSKDSSVISAKVLKTKIVVQVIAKGLRIYSTVLTRFVQN